MANFSTASLVKAQNKLLGAFQTPEFRNRVPEVHKLFVDNTSVMFADFVSGRTREDRETELIGKTRTARSLGSARTHNHTGAQGDSLVLTPTWATYEDKFASTLKEADNKIFSFEEMHMSKIENVILNFSAGLETAATGYLFANRSGVNVAAVDGTFDATDDTFEINETALGDQAIHVTKMVMDINKYQGIGYTVVCDSISYRKFMYQAAQGVSNATNTSFQFMNVKFIHAPELTALGGGLVSAYSKGYWIVVPDGTVAAPDWIPKQNKEGGVTSVNVYGQLINPLDNLAYAAHTYETRADGTSLGGYTQDVVIETQISIDLAYTHAPLSTATESSLMAFALV